MKLNECANEGRVLAALLSGPMPDELAEHLTSCPVCQDAQLVWSCLEACADAAAATEIPPAGVVWWKAQLAEKRAAALRSVAWIEVMQKIALAITVIAALAIGAWQAPKVFEIPPVLLAGSAAVLILFVASLLVVLGLARDSRNRHVA